MLTEGPEWRRPAGVLRLVAARDPREPVYFRLDLVCPFPAPVPRSRLVPRGLAVPARRRRGRLCLAMPPFAPRRHVALPRPRPTR